MFTMECGGRGRLGRSGGMFLRRGAASSSVRTTDNFCLRDDQLIVENYHVAIDDAGDESTCSLGPSS